MTTTDHARPHASSHQPFPSAANENRSAPSPGGAANDRALARFEFEGHPLAVHTFRDRPCWLVADVGRALGYAETKLADTMRQNWSDELVEGADFDTLKGDDLIEFKADFDPHETWVSKSRRTTILYESGANLVCLKTEKPLGKKLRRFLATEVMPRLARREPMAPPGLLPADAARLVRVESELAEMKNLIVKFTLAQADIYPGGVVGPRRADATLLGPLRSLARQLSYVRGKPQKSVQLTLDRRLRKLVRYPNDKGQTWAMLPIGDYGKATNGLGVIEVEARAELKEHAKKVAEESQLKLDTDD